ncbi:hypothetical protein [Aeoliella sp.]|uniref:hypothetical protein n=1 Tax=Aeoliella sp. TaxID=2795800 RepID=UPI003CCBE55A
MPSNTDNTARLAKELWNAALQLEAADFQSRFDSIYSAAEGPATLWHLGGAASDYLRAQPNSVCIPEKLPGLLLSSPLVDGRIVGLKLSNRLCLDPNRIVEAVCKALDSTNNNEVVGGLYELSELADRTSVPRNYGSPALLARLRKLVLSGDGYVAEASKRMHRAFSGEPAPG